MTNPIFNPQPNYSGVTIQISNPAVYTGQCNEKSMPYMNSGQIGVNNNLPNNQNYTNYPQGTYNVYATNNLDMNNVNRQSVSNQPAISNTIPQSGYQNAYPAQYYLNNYNYNNNAGINNDELNRNLPQNNSSTNDPQNNNIENFAENYPSQDNLIKQNQKKGYNGTNSYRIYASESIKQQENDMTKSQNIIEDIAKREADIQEEKKNTKETKIVALTDEYIKSLENYLNNPNDEIRLMASKEILTRLDEDKDRYDDAALNALLNKMLQDPNKLVRISALSAFASQLASGNDYTVKLLHNIQSNPNADKEDVLQAADILLKMSAGVEVKNIPNPKVKETKQQ